MKSTTTLHDDPRCGESDDDGPLCPDCWAEEAMDARINQVVEQWAAGLIDDTTCESILLQIGCEADLVATMIEQGPA